uniref:LIM zinc-binding domain-containing protein n=1 Tax=Trichobilharzia regenti TaxID=157069 RepID=A0AA85J7C5_TRIRE|nr:unnamed protein product [Trichobilharzia regenti]
MMRKGCRCCCKSRDTDERLYNTTSYRAFYCGPSHKSKLRDDSFEQSVEQNAQDNSPNANTSNCQNVEERQCYQRINSAQQNHDHTNTNKDLSMYTSRYQSDYQIKHTTPPRMIKPKDNLVVGRFQMDGTFLKCYCAS